MAANWNHVAHRVVSSRDYEGERYAIWAKCSATPTATIRLMRTARSLPSSREGAKGQRVRHESDKVIPLAALVNENNTTHSFAYDVSHQPSGEVWANNLTRRFSYNVGGHFTRLDEIGYGDNAARPGRHTLSERESIGPLIGELNHRFQLRPAPAGGRGDVLLLRAHRRRLHHDHLR